MLRTGMKAVHIDLVGDVMDDEDYKGNGLAYLQVAARCRYIKLSETTGRVILTKYNPVDTPSRDNFTVGETTLALLINTYLSVGDRIEFNPFSNGSLCVQSDSWFSYPEHLRKAADAMERFIEGRVERVGLVEAAFKMAALWGAEVIYVGTPNSQGNQFTLDDYDSLVVLKAEIEARISDWTRLHLNVVKRLEQERRALQQGSQEEAALT